MKSESDKPVVEFDHHSAEFSERWPEQLAEIRESCPVAWSESHGGYWVLTKADDVHKAGVSTRTFSSARSADEPDMMSETIPKMRYAAPGPVLSTEIDPPDFYGYRRVINKVLSPRAVAAIAPLVHKWTTWCLDEVIETGSCDLVADFAARVPASLTLEWVGLPVEKWRQFSDAQHNAFAFPPGHPKHQEALELKARVRKDLIETCAERRREPREDVLTYLVNAHFGDERALNDEEVLSIATLIIAGGVDTTASLVSSTLVHLDRHPEDRERLIEDRSLMLTTREEMLRVYPPAMAHARTVVEPTEVRGCPMHPGDRVLLSWAGANRDPETFPDPDDVKIDRFPNRHYTFGIGIHRCAGSHLARAMWLEMIGQVLDRIPDYCVTDYDVVETYPDKSISYGFNTIPATFTPGERSGIPSPL
jgi:cytochrome P450